MRNYQKWVNYNELEPELKKELDDLDEKQIEEAFSTDLEFGTGGMRGVLGPGINRMNIYTIRKATYGFGKYLGKNKSVVIAYDNRHKSKEFALETAKVFASMNIKAYLAKELRPTPFLSFAVRYLNASGGVMITASHNPKEYNGYKIYDENGCQLTPVKADRVIDNIKDIKDYFDIDANSNSELIEYLDNKIDLEYIKMVNKIRINKAVNNNFKIIYTPLHGTGSFFIPSVLKDNGFNCIPVKKEMVNDPDFSEVKSANPEEADAFINSIILGKKEDADLLIATDPDADRLGIAVLHKKEYKLLTGNQIAALLLNYILENDKTILKENSYIFTTIVSSLLPVKIAQKHDINVKTVLTGFKFIGEQAEIISKNKGRFVFGFEESYGYLISSEVRDKDAVQAALMISEACGYYLSLQKTLFDVLEDIYMKFGYYYESLTNVSLKGIEGAKKIIKIIGYFRNNKLTGFPIHVKEDYLLSKSYYDGNEKGLNLPKSNVIKYILDDDSWFVLRPSGTEPKLKIYFGVKDLSETAAKTKMNTLKSVVLDIVNKI